MAEPLSTRPDSVGSPSLASTSGVQDPGVNAVINNDLPALGEPSAEPLLRTGGFVRTCGHEICMKTTALRPCYACMREYYCSADCQRRAWVFHIAECRGGGGDPECVPRLFEYWQSVLTEDQMARVRGFQAVFKDYLRFEPSVMLRLVEGEIDPEREITGWERMAEAYKEVIASRAGKTGKLMRAKIYNALLAMSTVGADDIDALKKASVHAKKIGAKKGQLEKVVEVWQAAGCFYPIATWPIEGKKKKKKKKGKGKGKGK